MKLIYETKIGPADTKSKSSRTIIPMEIIRMLKLNWGDKLRWVADIENKGVTITVSKKDDNPK